MYGQAEDVLSVFVRVVVGVAHVVIQQGAGFGIAAQAFGDVLCLFLPGACADIRGGQGGELVVVNKAVSGEVGFVEAGNFVNHHRQLGVEFLQKLLAIGFGREDGCRALRCFVVVFDGFHHCAGNDFSDN